MAASIIYWKWDNSHFQDENKVKNQIDDIVNRSVFSHIYITTHWCEQGLNSFVAKNAINKATEYLHKKGRKMIFEIDARAEKAVFCKEHPNDKMGFTYNQILTLDEQGYGLAHFNLPKTTGEFFLGDTTADASLICSYVIGEDGEPIETPANIINNGLEISVEVKNQEYKNKQVFLSVCQYLLFPDLTSKNFFKFFEDLFLMYQDIILDGIALDEMGYPWHSKFNFNPSSYIDWNNSPIYGKSFESKYYQKYKTDYRKELYYTFALNENDSRKKRAINRYYEFLRLTVIEVENFFYQNGKKFFGDDCFIGVHPTWFAIEEVDNSPEIWKNGINWFEVKRDYGFTDEIMIMPVRFGLMHKAKSNLFYNMWYGEATGDINTYYQEIWNNVRFGGRTISLGYECKHEPYSVLELKNSDYLENISKIENRIKLLDQYQLSGAKSDICIITGCEASCNILNNLNKNKRFDTLNGVFKNSFILSRDIFNTGYNCDYTLTYEIYNGSLYINENGYLQYGNEEYKFVIFYQLQFCKSEVIDFLKVLDSSKTGYIIIGKVDTDFDGQSIYIKNTFDYRINAIDLLPYYKKYGVNKNRIPNGCYMQDGSLILTPACHNKIIENDFEAFFKYEEKMYKILAQDYAYIKFETNKKPIVISPKLIDLKIING